MEKVNTLGDSQIEFSTEQDVARLMMTNEAFLAKFSDHLSPQMFSELIRPVAEISLKYWQEFRQPVPPLALAQELSYKVGTNFTPEKKQAVLNLLVQLKHEPQAPEYTEKLIADFVRVSRMRNTLKAAVQLFKDKIEKGRELEQLDEIQRMIDKANMPLEMKRPTFLYRDIDARTEERAEVALGNIVYKSFGTGITEIDNARMPAKGLLPGELGIFIAPTGRGKSVALTHMAMVATFKGYKVLYISLELPEQMLANRADSMFTQTPVAEVVDHRNDIRETLLSQKESMDVGEIVFKDLSLVGCNVQQLRNIIDSIAVSEDFRPDLLVVDYMDLMSPVTKVKEGGWKEQQKVSEELRALGGELGIGVWTASQGNRGAAKKNEEGAVLEDTDAAESYNKLFAADWVMTLNRTKDMMKMPEPKPLTLNTVKNRTGIPGKIAHVLTDFSKMQFYVGDYEPIKALEGDSVSSGAFVKKGKKNGN